MSNLIFIGGQKGGSTKTTTAALLCLGSILRNEPAAYVATDPRREIKSKGRPYGVLDGRDAQRLAHIIKASHSTENGWLIIDGGGNRPDYDLVLSRYAALTLLPFRPGGEDIDMVMADLAAMPNSRAWPCAWPTNRMAEQEAKRHIEKVQVNFPLRLIMPPLHFVNCATQLTDEVMDSPASPLRNAARRAFAIMKDAFDEASHEADAPELNKKAVA